MKAIFKFGAFLKDNFFIEKHQSCECDPKKVTKSYKNAPWNGCYKTIKTF